MLQTHIYYEVPIIASSSFSFTLPTILLKIKIIATHGSCPQIVFSLGGQGLNKLKWINNNMNSIKCQSSKEQDHWSDMAIEIFLGD